MAWCRNCGKRIRVKMDAAYGWVHDSGGSQCWGNMPGGGDIKDYIATPMPEYVGYVGIEEEV